MKFLNLCRGNSDSPSGPNEEAKLWPSDLKFAWIITD